MKRDVVHPIRPTRSHSVDRTAAVVLAAALVVGGALASSGAAAAGEPRAGLTPTAAVQAGVSVVKPGSTTVTGSGLVDQPLTATTSGWTPEPVTFAYQWSVGGKTVAGATASTYTPVVADAGKRVTVSVTGSSPGATPATRIATLAGSVLQVGRISGTVSLPGTPSRPVTNGTAMLYRSYAIAGDYAQPVAYATIATNGRYSFSGVTPGDYTLKFSDRDTGQEAFLGGGISISASTPLTVTSGSQVTKNFIFSAIGSISGVLKLDGPAADPSDAFVITATSAKGSNYAIAEADGTFTIPGLPGGSYTLAVNTYNNRDQQSIYGTQVYTVGLGSTPGHVSVIAGRESTGVTITMKPAPLVTGLVTIADTGAGSPYTLIGIYRVVGGQPDRYIGDTQTETDGTFRLPPIEPGKYKLMAHPPAGEGLGDAYFGGTTLNTAKIFTLKNGDVVSGLTVKVPTVAP